MVEVIEVEGDYEDFDDVWLKDMWFQWAYVMGGWWVPLVGNC